MKERELTRAERSGVSKKPQGDRKCCAECDCEAQSLESIRNMCTTPEEHMVYVYIGNHVIKKTCSRKTTTTRFLQTRPQRGYETKSTTTLTPCPPSTTSWTRSLPTATTRRSAKRYFVGLTA